MRKPISWLFANTVYRRFQTRLERMEEAWVESLRRDEQRRKEQDRHFTAIMDMRRRLSHLEHSRRFHIRDEGMGS